MTRFLHSITRFEKTILLCCVLTLTYCAGGFWARAKTNAALPPVFADTTQLEKMQPKSGPVRSPRRLISVHVAGAVARPGVFQMPHETLARDALKRAGGATKSADLNSINLAQKLQDGEQIVLRAKGEMSLLQSGRAALGKGSTSSSAKLPLRPVNVNNAGDAELQTLPGIGPATSARIMEARAKKRFRSLSDLDEVKGLGPKKLEKLKPYVTF